MKGRHYFIKKYVNTFKMKSRLHQFWMFDKSYINYDKFVRIKEIIHKTRENTPKSLYKK